MSEAVDHTKKNISLIIAASTFILIAVNMTFFTIEENEQRVDAEVAALSEAMGNEGVQRIIDDSLLAYEWVMLKTGIEGFINKNFLNESGDYAADVVFEKANPQVERMAVNFKIAIYQMTLRYATLKEWFMLIAFLIAGLWIDGYYKRQVARYEVGVPSVGRSRLWYIIISLSMLIVSLYLMLPVEVGIMAFYLPLIFFSLVAVGGRYMIINFHKLF